MNDLPPPMRTVWHSLLWKEWHEHKWKLAALTAIMIAPMIVFGSVSVSPFVFVGVTSILPFYCALAGIFLGMSVAGGESGRGTLSFLQSLPIPMWRPGATKLIAAVITVVVPLLAIVGAFCIWWTFLWFDGSFGLVDSRAFDYHCWGISNGLVATTVGCVLGVSSFLLWTAAMGVNRADEIRAGAIGFLIICLVWFVLVCSSELAERQDLPPLRYCVEVLFAATAGGVAFVGVGIGRGGNLNGWYHYGPFLVSTIVGHGCVLAWYLHRFGKTKPGSSRADGKTLALAANGYQHLAPPMRSQLTAIAWKQFRETGPLALMAMGAVFLITAIFYFSDKRRIGMQDLGETMAGITMMVGFFVTLVTGIGVFLEDLKPRVDDFWRSRPVNYQLWFGVKFVVGAIVLAASFGTLLLLAYLLTDGRLPRDEFGNGEQVAQTIGAFVLVFLLIYTLSMATYCVLRQPLYAAVLTLGLLYCGTYAIALAVYFFKYFIDASMPWQFGLGLMLMLLCQVAATAFAWQAVKRNWHWGNQ